MHPFIALTTSPGFESHPKFNEKSFSEATETAWARNRLCLVYIPAEKGGGSKAAKVDDAICKALADAEVKASKVVWVVIAHRGGGGAICPRDRAECSACCATWLWFESWSWRRPSGVSSWWRSASRCRCRLDRHRHAF